MTNTDEEGPFLQQQDRRSGEDRRSNFLSAIQRRQDSLLHELDLILVDIQVQSALTEKITQQLTAIVKKYRGQDERR